MAAVFDLNEALPERMANPERFIACLIALAIRDRADHLFLEPYPQGDAGYAMCQYRVSGNQYDVCPPSVRILPVIARALRRRMVEMTWGPGGATGWFPARLVGSEFPVWVTMLTDGRDDRFTFRFPIRTDLFVPARELLVANTSADGTVIDFQETDYV